MGANLIKAQLAGADFIGAQLDGADLTDANLDTDHSMEVKFPPIIRETTKVTSEQIKQAKNWQLAFYDKDFKEKKLQLSNFEIKTALCRYLAEKNSDEPDEKLNKLYNEEVKKYQVNYPGFETPEGDRCDKGGTFVPTPKKSLAPQKHEEKTK